MVSFFTHMCLIFVSKRQGKEILFFSLFLVWGFFPFKWRKKSVSFLLCAFIEIHEKFYRTDRMRQIPHMEKNHCKWLDLSFINRWKRVLFWEVLGIASGPTNNILYAQQRKEQIGQQIIKINFLLIILIYWILWLSLGGSVDLENFIHLKLLQCEGVSHHYGILFLWMISNCDKITERIKSCHTAGEQVCFLTHWMRAERFPSCFEPFQKSVAWVC